MIRYRNYILLRRTFKIFLKDIDRFKNRWFDLKNIYRRIAILTSVRQASTTVLNPESLLSDSFQSVTISVDLNFQATATSR